MLYLAVIAVVLVGTVAYVVLGDDDPSYSTKDIFKETQVVINRDNAPNFVFPDEIRSTDLNLNRFIDRFFRICAEGAYSEFKLMYTNKPGQEISPERFESTFNVLKAARIIQLRRLPDLPQFEGPTWLLVSEFDLEAYAPTKQKEGNLIRLAIGRENDRWRLLGPVSTEAIERIDAYEKALLKKAAVTSQPTP